MVMFQEQCYRSTCGNLVKLWGLALGEGVSASWCRLISVNTRTHLRSLEIVSSGRLYELVGLRRLNPTLFHASSQVRRKDGLSKKPEGISTLCAYAAMLINSFITFINYCDNATCAKLGKRVIACVFEPGGVGISGRARRLVESLEWRGFSSGRRAHLRGWIRCTLKGNLIHIGIKLSR